MTLATGTADFHRGRGDASPDPALTSASVRLAALHGAEFLPDARPTVRGKFLFAGDHKLYVRGVTYGPFKPTEDGCEYHDAATVDSDFAAMAQHGINAVRVYTVPPRWLLDLAQRHGLHVMIGLPWEQHVTFLDSRARQRAIEQRIRESVRGNAKHPAVLCYVIGNEIPAHIVRWYGAGPVERFLRRLCCAIKNEDEGALVTFANYPSTEYLDLPFLDFLCFNLYLETREKLTSYLARLQNIAGNRPLVISEVGLDALQHGDQMQADVLGWQVPSVFAAGCAGMMLFAWTDEWYRGGCDIEDWQFGLTRADRTPRPALEAIRAAYGRVPFDTDRSLPSVSIVVCTYNGSRTIGQCLEGLRQLDYPRFQVIVVDDGSTDNTAEIVRQYDVHLISTMNQGLSSARNTGMLAATGDIIAYVDDDAYPDPHWLNYLVETFVSSDHAAVGGPNIAPPGDGAVADCVARSPGGPVHILLTDHVAEHVPGCNMAFRRERLIDIGGFDTKFRIAGDDVDVCWRIQQRGWTIGFSPAALMWHRRRNSITAYWRQQFNYGRAEAMLERKWPQKYNALGHSTWAGHVYAPGMLRALTRRRSRIYHGTWGSALFQSVYHTAPSPIAALPSTPEWYLIVAVLFIIGMLGFIWPSLMLAMPLAMLAALLPAAQAVSCAANAIDSAPAFPNRRRAVNAALIAWMHLIQPAARLLGRLRSGLTPWRWRGARSLAWPWPRTFRIWSEKWIAAEQRLRHLESILRWNSAIVRRGSDFDTWDLEVRGGLFGLARVRMTVEEHGNGRQLVRVSTSPCPAAFTLPLVIALLAFSIVAPLSPALTAFYLCDIIGAIILLLMLYDQSLAQGMVSRTLCNMEAK